jgi:hypothetical protein
MARKCGLCRKTGHDARTCPSKSKIPTKARAASKKAKTSGPLPDYFYENAPLWVANLTKAGILMTPSGTGGRAKSCGNCRYLTAGTGVATGEPYCSKNKAAVRGQWVCSKWASGSVGKIREPKLGEDA